VIFYVSELILLFWVRGVALDIERDAGDWIVRCDKCEDNHNHCSLHVCSVNLHRVLL
jgi:hypothetical protein